MKRINILRYILLFAAAVCALCAACVLSSCAQTGGPYLLVYEASEGGSISGDAVQMCGGNASGKEVAALPDEGYLFAGWSDGVTELERTDGGKDVRVKALFELEEVTLDYHYELATGNIGSPQIAVKQGEERNLTAEVPARDHFLFAGWYADAAFTRQVTDGEGRFTDPDLFDGSVSDLYARWQPVQSDVVQYDVLIVFVTEIEAKGMPVGDGTADILYSMTDDERAACERAAAAFEDAVNELTDGLIAVHADTYFTEQPLGAESLTFEPYARYILPENIPELQESGLLPKYRNVITCATFGDEMNGMTLASKGFIDARLFLNEAADEKSVTDYFVLTFAGNCARAYRGQTLGSDVMSLDAERRELVLKSYLNGCLPAELPDHFTEEQFYAAMEEIPRRGIPYGYWKDKFHKVTITTRISYKEDEGDDESHAYSAVKLYGCDSAYTAYQSDTADGINTITYTQTYILCDGMDIVSYAQPCYGCKFDGWDDGYEGTWRPLHIDRDLALGAAYSDFRLS